jgi:hypothetical protein
LMEKPLGAQELLQTIQTLLDSAKVIDPSRTSATFYYIAHDAAAARNAF